MRCSRACTSMLIALTGKPLYKRIAEETLDFVVREMRDAERRRSIPLRTPTAKVSKESFMSGVSMNSAKSSATMQTQLADYFDVTEHGNWEEHNILNVTAKPIRGTANAKIEAAKKKLYAAREKRVKPGRDEKILTDWNGLMLRAFAEAAAFLGRDDYRDVAEANANFILTTLWDGNRLLHSFKDGRARFNGYLDDYANLADGLFALYELTFDAKWLDAAVRDRRSNDRTVLGC